MPRFSTKKRKGFHGKKRWEINREESNLEVYESECDGPRPSTSQAKDYETPRKQNLSTDIRNISAEKLINTDSQSSDSKIITRSAGKRLGLSLCKAHVVEARGVKIQDFSLLQQCLESFAVCSKCKSSKSKLKIFEDNKKRKGLGECLFIKCSSCGAKQLFVKQKDAWTR